MAVATNALSILPFDERDELPNDADGFLVTLRATGTNCGDVILASRKLIDVSEMETGAPIIISAGAGASIQLLYVRGAMANGTTLQFLALAADMSLAYSIEAVRTRFNNEALA